ncbi:MAG: ferredoxin 2Fe-2S [Candidatus Scalindua rubra]|uniref:Ferredoxin 2Fe-2S n=1 Tax=Candidatus Scalindua rubra TaxID=1872076 RepID=A0A1E3XAW0_9BACT|nr:MAG: ferredoxin 2Fe-2S [Candidatus Scalindua rubra]
MYKILIALCIFLIVSFHYAFKVEGSDDVISDEIIIEEPEKEKSELAKLMDKIDLNYKAVEEMSGYYRYKKKQWKIVLKSGQNIVKVTKTVRRKFSKPDDWTYQELMEKMQIAAEEMVEIAKNKDKEGALEDAQWQVRLLRRTCAKCHKHLDIHIYPQLYKKKPKELPSTP